MKVYDNPIDNKNRFSTRAKPQGKKLPLPWQHSQKKYTNTSLKSTMQVTKLLDKILLKAGSWKCKPLKWIDFGGNKHLAQIECIYAVKNHPLPF